MVKETQKIIVIVGPTASGKSTLAVMIAKRCNGEVISADSRQVYKGMGLGSGKITRKETDGVPHHLLDVADPKRTFSAARYQALGTRAVKDILRRGKTPVICGGTGFYIRGLVDGLVMPEVKPNAKLRAKLSKKTAAELFRMLLAKDPERASSIDSHNPHRLIRALEIAETLGNVPPKVMHPLPYPTLFIGVTKDRKELERLVRMRLLARMKKGMIAEITKLHARGISWKRLESFGLEYRYGALLLQKKINPEEFKEKLVKEIMNYAKRQMTWFRHDPRIHWIKTPREANVLVKKFINT